MTMKSMDLKYFTFFIYMCLAIAPISDNALFDILKIASFGIYVVAVTFPAMKKNKFKITGLAYWYILFFLFAMSSYFWARYNKTGVFFYSKAMVQILANTFCIPLMIESEEDIYKIVKVTLYVLIFNIIVLLIKVPISQWGTERLGKSAGIEPNTVGIQMAYGALISFFFFWKSKKKNNLLLFILFVFIALLSGSKKAIIIIVLGILVLEFFYTNHKNIKQTIMRAVFILVAIIATGYLIFNNATLYNVIGSRIERTTSYILSKGDTFDNSTRERAYYISEAKFLFKNHPLVGVGLNNFQYYIGSIGYSHVAYSHNNYWEMLSCLGLVGTILLYSMYFWLLYSLIRNGKSLKNNIGSLLLTLMLIFTICDYLHISYKGILQFALISIVYCYNRQLYKKGEDINESSKEIN